MRHSLTTVLLIAAALTIGIAAAQAGDTGATKEEGLSPPPVTGTHQAQGHTTRTPVGTTAPAGEGKGGGGGYDSGSGNGYDPGGPGSNGGYLGDPNHPGHEQF